MLNTLCALKKIFSGHNVITSQFLTATHKLLKKSLRKKKKLKITTEFSNALNVMNLKVILVLKVTGRNCDVSMLLKRHTNSWL